MDRIFGTSSGCSGIDDKIPSAEIGYSQSFFAKEGAGENPNKLYAFPPAASMSGRLI
ncbi:MAG: hypothetical protein JW929_02825 [Anaerolineales bacterium]|nr:hypothetical protein [Anaerolineales bacterium]